jgi:transposase
VWERDDVPPRVRGSTDWRRLRDWYQAGVWRRLHQVLLEELAQADRIDWDRAALDSAILSTIKKDLRDENR